MVSAKGGRRRRIAARAESSVRRIYDALPLGDSGRWRLKSRMAKWSGSLSKNTDAFRRFERAEAIRDRQESSGSVVAVTRRTSTTLLLTNGYPSDQDLYRNAFLRTRVQEYARAGHPVDVFRFDPAEPPAMRSLDGTSVRTGFTHELRAELEHGAYPRILVHFPDSVMWSVLRSATEDRTLIFWLHGAEAQSWRRREFLHETAADRRRARTHWETRASMWRDIITTPDVDFRYVVVSAHLRREIEEDLGIELPPDRTHVIHNHIDSDRYAYVKKRAEDRLRILSIRPYASAVYANDLTVDTIVRLGAEPFFGELSFRLVGDGPLFADITRPLRRLTNVELDRRFLRPDEMADAHRDHGIFLVPTRMDSQGVSRDEAMASGLVPVTNRVAAVPEFVDDGCAVLAAPESSEELAAGIRMLYEQPVRFLRMSQAAAARVRAQSGHAATIERELALIVDEHRLP